ncbi:MAG: methyltransferase domain-containing protein [Chitinophagaceae bacterium]
MMPEAARHINGTHYFQQQYIALREKEMRLYSDEQVRQLPFIGNDHPHYDEWLVRRNSSEKLLKRIRKMKMPLKILDVGCGNGWLSNQLSQVPGTEVTGFDINLVELQQAKRVFQERDNLQFASNSPFQSMQGEQRFDLILFAASIQYFSSLNAVISEALQKLTPRGRIHIIDSHFYAPEELAAARQRTVEHYKSLGFDGLSAHYFHHTLNALKPFNFEIVYNPDAAWNKLRRKKAPFHWISIKKS